MKKIIYNVIKYPLILIFIKTPLINFLIKRHKYYRFNKNSNIFQRLLDHLFLKEYFCKLKDKYLMRELTNLTLKDGEGRKWAELHYKKFTDEKTSNNFYPLFKKMINFIQSNNFSDDKDVCIIQLGSSSGKDLEFFIKKFPKLTYISTDINNEILDFQKEKYRYVNLKYFVCFAENIDECINFFKLSDKKIILFSIGILQYVNTFFLKEFFLKLKKYKKINLFINEPIDVLFYRKDNKKLSSHRGNISFSHHYDEYAKAVNLNIIEKKIITENPENNKESPQNGSFYLQSST